MSQAGGAAEASSMMASEVFQAAYAAALYAQQSRAAMLYGTMPQHGQHPQVVSLSLSLSLSLSRSLSLSLSLYAQQRCQSRWRSGGSTPISLTAPAREVFKGTGYPTSRQYADRSSALSPQAALMSALLGGAPGMMPGLPGMPMFPMPQQQQQQQQPADAGGGRGEERERGERARGEGGGRDRRDERRDNGEKGERASRYPSPTQPKESSRRWGVTQKATGPTG
jgi:hypothetical protein